MQLRSSDELSGKDEKIHRVRDGCAVIVLTGRKFSGVGPFLFLVGKSSLLNERMKMDRRMIISKYQELQRNLFARLAH